MKLEHVCGKCLVHYRCKKNGIYVQPNENPDWAYSADLYECPVCGHLHIERNDAGFFFSMPHRSAIPTEMIYILND
ncbi:MAG TPA: hypothetical protein PLA71_00800 [Saccharofermentans sp.]|nr:hypothetical protein [Saccharofermentans sp.]